MLKNYLKIAWRNLLRNKSTSFINIGGLATGMAVVILIALWMYDELSFNHYYKNHDRIAQVVTHSTNNGQIRTQTANAYVLGETIRAEYGDDFRYIVQGTNNNPHVFSIADNKFTEKGSYFEPEITEMLSLQMLRGNREGLKDPYSILLSASLARTWFGDADPLDKTVRIDNMHTLKVTGVYEDFPANTSFATAKYMLPWELLLISEKWIRELSDPWDVSFSQTYVQIADNADMAAVSAKIRDVKLRKINKYAAERIKPQLALHPMDNWHLYNKFENGVNAGGGIEFVWLFGIIGLFVLILAAINFMNLSTARSEKRAKEVGIRKAIGSMRRQLIAQFFSESVLVSLLAFLLSLGLVLLILPGFNEIADKKIVIDWSNPSLWLAGTGFSVITGLFAGLYPAIYLSSFRPVKVLKGTFRTGRFAAIPRKALVVIQFTVSVTLIIGTFIVYRQIQYGKDRPMGYDSNGLIRIDMLDPAIGGHFEELRQELISSGAIEEVAASESPTTDVWNTNGGFDWEGKDPSQVVSFTNDAITCEFGKTIGWQFINGRDFSRALASDSAAFVVNESAIQLMGIKDPVGKVLQWDKKPYTIIGVIKDMLVQSPYDPSRASVYHLGKDNNVILIRQSAAVSTSAALDKIKGVFKKYSPSVPFQYRFVDEDYARKFSSEERIGKLTTLFAILAVLISCLGLFGLASFIAEQRTKEIGIRKVVGASVFSLWRLLSKDFVVLVIISCLISIPLSWYYMNNWLMDYKYHTTITWHVFAAAIAGALLITLLTVSYQAIRAAIANPVKSLRTE